MADLNSTIVRGNLRVTGTITGNLSASSLPASGATAGSYGDSSAQTPGHGGTFKVPYLVVDSYGRITGISEHNVTIPSSTVTGSAAGLTPATPAGDPQSSDDVFILSSAGAGASASWIEGSTKYALAGHSHSGYLTSSSIADMATQTWVGNQGFLTSHQSVSSSNNTASWGSAVTVGSVGGVDLKFTMPSNPNSDTASAADNILDGSNSGTQITYAPYSSQQSKLSFDTSSTNPSRSDRLNLNGYLYATKLYSGGTEVSVSGHTHSYAGSSSAGGPANNLAYTTTPPTSNNNSGLKVYVGSEPSTRYNGWLYIIT